MRRVSARDLGWRRAQASCKPRPAQQRNEEAPATRATRERGHKRKRKRPQEKEATRARRRVASFLASCGSRGRQALDLTRQLASTCVSCLSLSTCVWCAWRGVPRLAGLAWLGAGLLAHTSLLHVSCLPRFYTCVWSASRDTTSGG